ncbi:ABC transporter substrate-binding protein [Rhizobium sp.]|jgi:iron complex transport system substrate-binding protein|uniref:heme/hemin ABC transporter substrate-binding protein n=1 Tax=Rhizobium sp. TaxID=391 RepID=UPI000E97EE3A|nr:hemin ABC transporter substrate-binding protein [Rhizobium sp.]
MNRIDLVKTLAAVIIGIVATFASTMAMAQQNSTPSKIVAIGGSLTEIVYALGEEKRLVGRDSTSVYPLAALKLPDAGYIRALSPEGILSLNPDLILMLDGAGPPAALETLKAAGVPMVMIPDGYDEASIARKVEAVGKVLGVEQKAHLLANHISAELQAALAANNGQPQKARVLFILSLQNGKVMAAGGQNHADGIVKLAGGDNVMTSITGYKQVSDEAIINAAPDAIVIMSGAGGHAVDDQTLFNIPAIAATPAGKARRVIRLDGMTMLGFGPRTAEAVTALHAALYPAAAKTK